MTTVVLNLHNGGYYEMNSMILAMGSYLTVWGLFSVVMFVGTFRLNRALQWVFGTLVVLFFLLAFGDFVGAGSGFKQFTGFERIVWAFRLSTPVWLKS